MGADYSWRLSGSEADALQQTYLAKLNDDENEQFYQNLIEENTYLMPRDFVQNHGIHLCIALRKLSFGADFKSDFFFLSKSSISWNCVFIEIEKPSSRYFKENSNDLHADFFKAYEQIQEWKSWFENDGNRQYFLDSTLACIRKPLASNPCKMRYILIHGRRNELSTDIRRKKINSYQDSNTRIMSFDSLAENLEAKHKLYIGSKINSGIKILSNSYVDDSFISWLDPQDISVSHALEKDILRCSYQNSHISDGNGGFVSAVTKNLPLMRRH